ncbi:MAG TPA: DUF72 domain-containing protein [Methylomirabilota bacterium]|nr:DUF72 domain-containing protein [Methylomirabilota bacterium]
MDVRVGTSGFAYKEWKGTFYPTDIKAQDMLHYYAGQLNCVEINNTFYRMPSETVLREWAEQVPDAFTFVLKAPQLITHRKRLKEVESPAALFFERAGALGPRLGPLLFQLPPNLKKDMARLTSFLAQVPADRRVALEVRHESWYDDEVYEALRARDVALCVADTDEAPASLQATAGWGYLRLRRVEYTTADLQAWCARITSQPWRDAFVFFKHEDEATGPRLARQFVSMLPS